MIHVAVGTDVYGAVRSVDRTPIVTKFAMVQFVPIYPLGSFYLGRLGEKTGFQSPLIGGLSQRALTGIQCDRINRLSVLVAYARGVGAVLAFLGTIILFIFLVGMLSDGALQLSKERQLTIVVAASMLAGGLLLAIPTYLFTVIVPQRERRIRHACARVLGIAADPAEVKSEIASEMILRTCQLLEERGIPDLGVVLSGAQGYGLDALDTLLVRTRARIMCGDASTRHEADTDRILQAIDLIASQTSDGFQRRGTDFGGARSA
jgi:hypothetical protein